MTIQERADKIANHVRFVLNAHDVIDVGFSAGLQALITSQLDEAVKEHSAIAVREETQRNRLIIDKMIDKAFPEGFASAREKAAGIVAKEAPSARSNGYGFVADRYEYLAERIRAMVDSKPEL